MERNQETRPEEEDSKETNMTDNNGRVTTREFYELQLEMMDKMLSKGEFKEFKNEIRAAISGLEGVPELARVNKEEIDRLRGEGNVVKVVGLVITAILGYFNIVLK